MSHQALRIRLTPSGELRLEADAEGQQLDGPLATGLLEAFAGGSGAGLLHLGGVLVATPLPAELSWWRALGKRYLVAVCTRSPGVGPWATPPLPPDEVLEDLVVGAPPMQGGEYLTPDVLREQWARLDGAFAGQLERSGASLPDFVKGLNRAWNVVGRVHFNLAENRQDPATPFAFMATYTTRMSEHGTAQHKPLGRALREYAGAANKEQMLSLLLPVRRAAESCDWLRGMVDRGEIFHPLRWSPDQAFRMLSDVEPLEQAGVIVRMPATWRLGRPARPKVAATVGAEAPSMLGLGALLDFRVELSLDGEPLTEDEVLALLDGSRGLALIRGQWVEVDPERLRRTLERFEEARDAAGPDGLALVDALRLVSGADLDGAPADEGPSWGGVVAGPWLAETLAALRSPARRAEAAQVPDLEGTLRPYQQVGLQWLDLLTRLGLGACLADDMGLGKTIQVLALLLSRRRVQAERRPSLLVAPASLLANWSAELERFAPSLVPLVVHASAMPAPRLKALGADDLAGADLVLTTYGSLLRLPVLGRVPWDLVILDEAQAIKNPAAKQTKAAKKLAAGSRIALTGTPIENRLSDLWSLFDFINPGLLGSARQFTDYTKQLSAQGDASYAPLRQLVSPYILRRLKTDRSIITDLPEKTEVKAWCQLSRKQAALYQQAVDDLAEQLASAEGIQRRGIVLAFLMRFKQLCNHPSQWLGDSKWAPTDSGKWARLREICEVIAARQDKVLVFTQFREVIPPLQAFLGSIFGRPGLALHGGTPVRQRKDLVARFQQDESVPFFLLSLKAGGSGLNLTAASHVVHFDRWWNPAVENQATDRAFRIGQANNVLVHKFVCRGTVEDRIDALIESKRALSEQLLDGSSEVQLTELSDAELLKLVALDLNSAIGGEA